MTEEIKKEGVTSTPNNQENEKPIFTQSQTNLLVGTTRKEAREKAVKAVYEELGITSKEDFEQLKERADKYEESNKLVQTYKQKEAKEAVMKKIAESGIDPEFAEYVYSTVPKGENEEEYQKNLVEFAKKHPKMTKENFMNISSQPDINHIGAKIYSAEQLEAMSDEELQEIFNKA